MEISETTLHQQQEPFGDADIDIHRFKREAGMKNKHLHFDFIHTCLDSGGQPIGCYISRAALKPLEESNLLTPMRHVKREDDQRHAGGDHE